MKPKFLTSLRIYILAVFSITSAAWSQDAPLDKLEINDILGKKTYLNVRVLGVTDKGLKITHDAGIAVVAFEKLPPEIAAKYAVPTTASSDSPGTGASMSDASSSTESNVAADATVTSLDPKCLVFIKTEGDSGPGAGSGFIAVSGTKTYVYTNAHVLCGGPGGFTKKIVSIKTAAGRDLPIPYELELSDQYDPNAKSGLEDLARFAVNLKAGEVAYQIATDDVPIVTTKPIVAYGNSLGMDVMTTLEGKIVALGSDRIEISCEIVPGNSGGPVVFADSKQVVGVSTYLDASGARDIWSKNTSFDTVRRFAIRPEKVTKWRKIQYTSLMLALEELRSFERDTLTLAAACFLDPKPNRGGFDVPSTQRGDFVIRQIIADGGRHPLGGTISGGIARVNQRLGAASSKMSMSAVVPVFAEFFSSVTTKSNSQMSSLKTSDRAPYLKQFFDQLIAERKPIHDQFVREGLTRYR